MRVQPCPGSLLGSHGDWDESPGPVPLGVPSCITWGQGWGSQPRPGSLVASHGDRDEGPALKLWVTGMGTWVQTPSVSPRVPSTPAMQPQGESRGSFTFQVWHPDGCPLGWVLWGASMLAAPRRAEPCTGRVGCWGPPSPGDKEQVAVGTMLDPAQGHSP